MQPISLVGGSMRSSSTSLPWCRLTECLKLVVGPSRFLVLWSAGAESDVYEWMLVLRLIRVLYQCLLLKLVPYDLNVSVFSFTSSAVWLLFRNFFASANFHIVLPQMYKFAGSQSGVECWCGDKYGKFGKSNKCNMKCRTEYMQMCGGHGANTVMRAFVPGTRPNVYLK